MNRFLSGFIITWGCFAFLVNVVAIIGLFIGAGGFWAGLWRVWDIYSPFNVWNWLGEVILISPAIGAAVWLERREDRQRRSRPTTPLVS